MGAIPELRETWVFSLTESPALPVHRRALFQFALHRVEPVLWLSRDPVLLDALMLDRINTWRKKNRFEPVSEEIRTLEFAEILGVGSAKVADAKIIDVTPRNPTPIDGGWSARKIGIW